MKRSKIFFGLTAGCLAIAGAVAAKVNHFNSTAAFYFVPSTLAGDGHDHCISLNTPCVYKSDGQTTCAKTVTIGGVTNTYTVYTKQISSTTCATVFDYDVTSN